MESKKIIKKNTVVLMLLLLVALFSSCEKNDDGNNPSTFVDDGVSQSTLDQGADIQRNFMGRIIDESSIAVGGVDVTIGNKTAVTDDNGVFIINDVTIKERQAFVKAEKPGFLKGMRSVVPTNGTNMVRIMLIAEHLAGTVMSGTDSEVSLSNGAKVRFDGNFKDENGNPYSGDVDVYMYHLNPSNPYIDDVMPGSLQAENSDGEERILETYGMLNVELRGTSGEKLNIANGHVAEIEIPISLSQTGIAPPTIPLWHFDEVAGHWIEGGIANLSAGKYRGEVSHFSWWNCDAQFPTVNLCLTVEDDSGNPISNVKVELWRSGATHPRIGYSDVLGEICGLIPANELILLVAFDQCGAEAHTTTIGPFSSDTNYGSVVLSGTATSTISGNLVNCSSIGVTNGYVSLTYGTQFAAAVVTNGAFDFSVINCPSLSTFSLEGVDYDTFQTTNGLAFDFSNSNVGNLIACNAIVEYVSIQVDNNPVDYYLANINANSYTSGNGFSINAQNSSDEYFYIGGTSTALGTYMMNSQDFGIEISNLDIDYNIPNSITFTLAGYGAIGGYVDITLSGTYTDTTGALRTITGTIHVLRDS